MKKKLLLVFTLICLNTFAQVPYLIKDINKSVTNSASSNPGSYFPFNSKSLFMATNVETGNELWITNGTDAGTTLVKDINPGDGSSTAGNFILFNNKVFFVANNGTNGKEVWYTDGTSLGTKMLSNLNTANDFNVNNIGDVSKFVVFGNLLYFRIIINQKEYLYSTDGTESGTVQISLLSNNSFLNDSEMFVHLGKIYFNSFQATGYFALFTFDISAQTKSLVTFGASTRYVSSQFCTNNSGLFCIIGNFSNFGLPTQDVVKINTSTNVASSVKLIAQDNQNYELFAYQNMIYFTAKTLNEGVELWKSDGTVAGTSLTNDLFVGATSSNPTNFNILSGDIIFEAKDSSNGRELFKYNIGSNQITLLKDITLGGDTAFSLINRIVSGQFYYFVVTVAGQPVFYRTDGTTSGTVVISDIVPNVSSINYGFGFGLLNGDIIMCKIYSCNNGAIDNLGYELYKFDVAFETFDLVKNINFTSNTNSFIDVYEKINNDFIFASSHKDFGQELWKTNITPNNASLIKDQNIGVNNFVYNSMDNIIFNNVMYFPGNNGVGFNLYAFLYKSDGTAAGTLPVLYGNNAQVYSPSNFTLFNGVVYFFTETGKLNKILNDLAIEVQQYGLVGQSLTGSRSSMVVNNGELYQLIVKYISNTTQSIELWKLNTTGAGATLIKSVSIPLAVLNLSNSKFNLASFNNMLYFPFYSVAEGIELWKSDGTTNGTVLLKDISIDANNPNSIPNSYVVYNNELFFNANEGVNSYLWKTNGTTVGTTQLKNKKIRGDLKSIFFDGKLFFIVRDTNIDEVYSSDGTQVGTTLFYNVPNSPSLSTPLIYQNKLLISSKQQNEVYAINNSSSVPYLYFKKIGYSEGFFKNVNESLFMTSSYNKNSGEYGQELWVLGNCNDTANAIVGSINTVSDNVVEEKLNPSTTCHCDEWNSLIVKLQSAGISPYTGEVKNKVWVDATTNQNYVKRHYQLFPQENISTSTGIITLYFSQQEFTEYNALNPSSLLPVNATDVTNKANLLIERFAALSTDSTGSPNSYAASGVNINPNDNDIIWNGLLNRWEVTFTGNLLGGYFVKSNIASLDSTQFVTTNNIGIYPNPTFGVVTIDTLESSICSIYDFTGKLVKSKTIDSTDNSIDISELQKGVYIFSVDSQNFKTVKKIIKK